MRTSIKVLCVAVAAAGMFGVAGHLQAGIAPTVTWVDVGVPNDTDHGLMTGYHGYILRLVSSSGNLSAVDFGVSAPAPTDPYQGPNTGITASAGVLANVQYKSGASYPATALDQYNNTTPITNDGTNFSVLSGASNNYDSHFLDTTIPANDVSGDQTSQLVISTNPSETSTALNTPAGAFTSVSAVHYTWDTVMKGAYGINTGGTSTFDVAYLVIKDGGTVSFAGAQATVGGQGGPSFASTFVGASDLAAAPEPASVGVLALGGLALLARRRRKA